LCAASAVVEQLDCTPPIVPDQSTYLVILKKYSGSAPTGVAIGDNIVVINASICSIPIEQSPVAVSETVTVVTGAVVVVVLQATVHTDAEEACVGAKEGSEF
jgi:hypothetical protein